MILTIPDEFLEKNKLSSQKIKQDIALLLFEKCSLTLEQASLIAEIPITEFKVLVDKKPSLKPFSKLSGLKNRNCVNGNSDDLIHIDWSNEWKMPFI